MCVCVCVCVYVCVFVCVCVCVCVCVINQGEMVVEYTGEKIRPVIADVREERCAAALSLSLSL